MRVVVWNGCRVISEAVYEGEGPDIHLDPVHMPDRLSVRWSTEHGEFSTVVDLLIDTEDTMHKVWAVLERAGLSRQQTIDAVTDMQNNGIYFRERAW